jgi:hypothetical protein
MNRSLALVPFLVLVTVAGCQRGDKSQFANVKGKVTYNGSPIEKGEIAFTHEGQPPMTMKIVDGAFNGQAMVGRNKVAVTAWKKNPTAARRLSEHAQIQMRGYQEKFKHEKKGGPISEYDPTTVNYIPPEWGAQSKETRVVEAGSANDFEFDVKGKN